MSTIGHQPGGLGSGSESPRDEWIRRLRETAKSLDIEVVWSSRISPERQAELDRESQEHDAAVASGEKPLIIDYLSRYAPLGEAMTPVERMWPLAGTFPTLYRWAADHAHEPFTGDHILQALREPWVTSGSRYALLFLADVWNASMREEMPRKLRQWSISDAFHIWDGQHRAAALAWFANPWWP